MTRHLFQALLLASLASGCGPALDVEDEILTDPETGQAIINGQRGGDPGVGILFAGINQRNAQGKLEFVSKFICSGSLVAQRKFLTAAHCVRSVEINKLVNPQFRVRFDNDPSRLITVEAVHVPETWRPRDFLAGSDVAVLNLAVANADLAKLPPRVPVINRDKLDSRYVGNGMRLVGYGDDTVVTNSAGVATDTIGAGIKRVQGARLLGFGYRDQPQGPIKAADRLLDVGDGGNRSGSCSGDSGGPALMSVSGKDRIVGVVSFGRQNCDDGRGYYTRLDNAQYNRFLAKYLGADFGEGL